MLSNCCSIGAISLNKNCLPWRQNGPLSSPRARHQRTTKSHWNAWKHLFLRIAEMEIKLCSYRWVLSHSYEVRIFPWEILTIKGWKIMKLSTNKLKLDLKLLPKNIFQRNHFHREIDQWNWRWFGAKWNVTVPNSVTAIKPIVCEWIYMSEEWYFQMTGELHISKIFVIFVKLWFWAIFFIKFTTKNAVSCRRLVQQELNVAYETSIFWSMFTLHKYRRTRTYGWEAIASPAATTSRDENFEFSCTFMFNSSSNYSLNMGHIVMNF